MFHLFGMILLALLSFFVQRHEVDNGKTFITKLHKRNHYTWYTSEIIIQDTRRYRNDSLISTETWYEVIVFPKKFRIDFGDYTKGNCIIYRNDSAYVLKDNKCIKAYPEQNDLLFLLGGMYSEPTADAVRDKLAAFGFDWNKSYNTEWKGRDIVVIGAASVADTESSQIWMDTKQFTLVRMIKHTPGQKMECVFSGHKDYGRGFIESAVAIYINGHLVQQEQYSSVSVDKTVQEDNFRPYY